MTAHFLTLIAFALAATASPVVLVRDDTPKPAKSGSGGRAGSGSTPAPASSGSSSGGLSSFAGLGALSNLGMMSSSELKKGDFTCKKAALIFARGTGEPGNMGYVVGPGLGNGLKKALNNDILIQGADYSTDFSGGGAKEMVTLTKSVISKCPETKIILGGYSQGAMQVHQALGSLGADASKIAAAVTFGDPYSNQGWGSGGIVGAVMGLGGSTSSATSSSGARPKSSGSNPKSSGSTAVAAAPKPAVEASTGGTGFDPNNGLIICSTGDFVCGVVPNFGASVPKPAADAASKGTGGAGHLSYYSDGSIPRAITFITTRVNGAPAAE